MRVVNVMWLGEPASEEKLSSPGILRLALFLSCLGVLLLGVVPGWTMKLAELGTRMFGS